MSKKLCPFSYSESLYIYRDKTSWAFHIATRYMKMGKGSWANSTKRKKSNSVHVMYNVANRRGWGYGGITNPPTPVKNSLYASAG